MYPGVGKDMPDFFKELVHESICGLNDGIDGTVHRQIFTTAALCQNLWMTDTP